MCDPMLIQPIARCAMPIYKEVNCVFKDARAQVQNLETVLQHEEGMMLGLQDSSLVAAFLCSPASRSVPAATEGATVHLFLGRTAAVRGKKFLVLETPILE